MQVLYAVVAGASNTIPWGGVAEWGGDATMYRARNPAWASAIYDADPCEVRRRLEVPKVRRSF